MTNRDKVLRVLLDYGSQCDSCLQSNTKIINHATVNQITRELASHGVITRNRDICPIDGREKYINTLVDSNKSQNFTSIGNTPKNVENHIIGVNYHEKWFWEGNVQNSIVQYLIVNGYTILSSADTNKKEPGIDIVSISSEKRRLLITVKGFPNSNNSNKTTQARHWFGEALFDLIRYRQGFPEAMFGIGLPKGFTTFVNLSKKILWFKDSLPFIYYWVDDKGNVSLE